MMIVAMMRLIRIKVPKINIPTNKDMVTISSSVDACPDFHSWSKSNSPIIQVKLIINDLVLALLEWFDFFFDIEAATAALLLEIKA